MAMTETDIKIIIAAELKKQGFDKAQKATGQLDKTFKKLAGTLAATFSAQQIIAFGKASIKAFSDDEKAARRLTQTLGNMGLAFEDPRVKDFIAKLEATSGVLDDQLRPAMQSLLTTTGSVAKSQELLTLALDIAAGSGEDVVTVANDLSRAYVGNTKGLQKYKLGLNKTELATKSFSEIQALLGKQFSGQNAAFLDTYAGKVSLLRVAYANMQETIGKGLVDSFNLLSGDMGIAGATKAMQDFGQQIADVTLGAATLIDFLNNIPGMGNIPILDVGNIPVVGAWLKILQGLGQGARLAPQPFKTPMTITGQTDYYNKQDAARKKAEAEAAKRAKALAALQKKAELERLKREKEAQQLKRAGSIFDMENIQIVAAMQGKIDGEQRMRLVALLALNNGIADAAEKASTAVLAMNAPALASLGVIIQAGDTITDVIGKLINAQAKTALVQIGITNIPKAKNPFEDWNDILKKIIFDLDAIAAKIKNMPKVSGTTTTTTTTTTPSGTTTTTTIPSGGGGGTGANGFAYPTTPPGVSGSGSQFGSGTPWAQAAAAFMESVADMPGVSGSASQFGANTPWALAAAATAERLASIPGVSGSSSQFGSSTPWAQAAANFANTPTVTVVVQGSLIAQQDLVEVITDELYNNQKAGKGILLSSTAI